MFEMAGSSRGEVDRILSILDDAARDFTFPMLDNGYVYPAAARLSAFSGRGGWALVVETFGYAPRGAIPDLTIQTFAGAIHGRSPLADLAEAEVHRRHRDLHPHDGFETVRPIEDDAWIDGEHVAEGARHLTVRGQVAPIPNMADLAVAGIELVDGERVSVIDVARHLAETRRDAVLATPEERRSNVDPGLPLVLVLDGWRHPDLADGELPSETEAFHQIAHVLATGIADWYDPTEEPNTDWRNWPDGGIL